MSHHDAPAERARVRARIGHVLVGLWRAGLDHSRAWSVPSEFRATDLLRAVEAEVGPVASGSPDRILRALRAERRLHYVLVSRSGSLYRWAPLPLPEYREPVQRSLFEARA